jgi:hypothetical protein
MKLNELKESLNRNIMIVRFTKLNGEERIMRCTRNLNFMPPLMVKTMNPEHKTDRPSTSTNVTVWDLDAAGWRTIADVDKNVISASLSN